MIHEQPQVTNYTIQSSNSTVLMIGFLVVLLIVLAAVAGAFGQLSAELGQLIEMVVAMRQSCLVR